MIYSGEDFERKYKLCLRLLKLSDDGALSENEVWVLRRWFKLNSFVWISAELDYINDKAASGVNNRGV